MDCACDVLRYESLKRDMLAAAHYPHAIASIDTVGTFWPRKLLNDLTSPTTDASTAYPLCSGDGP